MVGHHRSDRPEIGILKRRPADRKAVTSDCHGEHLDRVLLGFSMDASLFDVARHSDRADESPVGSGHKLGVSPSFLLDAQ